MTSNAAEEFYPRIGYDRILEAYRNNLNAMVGSTKIMVCGDTLQVSDYSKYNWTMFDPESKKARRDAIFPADCRKAYTLGADMISNPWE